MAVTPPPPQDEPEPRPHAAPLSRSEERRLTALEDELRRSAPALEGEMAALGTAPSRPPAGRIDRALQVAAAVVIALVVLPEAWLAGVLLFGLVFGVPLVMVVVAVRARRKAAGRPGPDAGTGPGGGPDDGPGHTR